MRDLDKQIADWRRTLRPEMQEELEAHLREEIERLMRSGISPEQAFELAVSKLGQPTALRAEFDKLEEMRRAKWKPATLAQWACIAISLLSAVLLIPRISHGRMTLLLASHVLPVTIGYVTMFLIGGLATCYVLADWFQQTRSNRHYALRRTTLQLATISAILTAVGIVLGMIWAKENWGRYWAWDPKENGALLVLLCGVAITALRWFRSSHKTLIVMGILGSVGTAIGWFGANDSTRFHPLLIAFIAGHGLVLVALAVTSLRKRESLS